LNLRLQALVALPLVLLCAEFALARLLDAGSLEVGAPVYALGLLLLAEVAYPGLEPSSRAPAERKVRLRRAGALGMLAAGTLLSGGVVLGVASTRTDATIGFEVLGLVSAVSLLTLLTALARRASGSARGR
jgi:hypothetical protein